MHLEAMDLNLLVALRALLEERHVTRAARRVGLSQPAMSHALARLRGLLDDPLLVRTSKGMQPSARASGIVRPLARALEDVERALAAPKAFDPTTSTQTFRIATNDYIELVVLPRLLATLSREAPGVDVRVASLGSRAFEHLGEGRSDIAIGVVGAMGEPIPPRGIRSRRLLTDDFVCVVREGHPRLKKRLSLDDFVSLSHALVAPRGKSGSVVDTALAKLGKTRRVAVEVPHFLVAPHIVRETDLILTLARRVARALAPLLGLRQLAPPLELPGFSMAMVWHERQHNDPAHVWLRAVVASAAAELEHAPSHPLRRL